MTSTPCRLIFILLLLAVACVTAEAQQIRSSDYSFAITLPKGYPVPKPTGNHDQNGRSSYWVSVSGINTCLVAAFEYPRTSYNDLVANGTVGQFEEGTLGSTAEEYCKLFRNCRISEERRVGLNGAAGYTFRMEGYVEGARERMYGRVAAYMVENRKYVIELFNVRREQLDSKEADAYFRSFTFQWSAGHPPHDSVLSNGQRTFRSAAGRYAISLVPEVLPGIDLVTTLQWWSIPFPTHRSFWWLADTSLRVTVDYADYPDSLFEQYGSVEPMIDNMVEMLVRFVPDTKTEVVDQQPLRLGGHPGRSILLSFTTGGSTFHQRLDVVIARPRVYTVSCLVTHGREQITSAPVRAMFNSFTIVPDLEGHKP